MSLRFTRSFVFRNKIHPILAKFPFYDYWLLRKKSHLKEIGWFNSFRKGESVDANSDPIPWFVYGAIQLLEERLPPDANVFEYGSGMGTKWWGERAHKVVSVEHHAKWIEKIKPLLPDNVEILHRDVGNGYENAVNETGEKYDVIIIDGRNRPACCRYAVESISGRGIIVFDDSAWEKYHDGLQLLKDQGFRQLPFRGFSPIEFMTCETSIFYKDGNLVGI